MEPIELSLETDIGYDSIPLPEELILPIPEGKVGIWRYRQHKSDPIRVRPELIQHVSSNRIRISMRGMGRLDIKHFFDPKIDGTEMDLEGDLRLKDGILSVEDLSLARLDLPVLPDPIDDLFRKKLNQILVDQVSQEIEFDLNKEIDRLKTKVNQPNPMNFKFGNTQLNYAFRAGLDSAAPSLLVMPDCLRVRLQLEFSPTIEHSTVS